MKSAAILLTIHGNFKEMLTKTKGSISRINEFLLIKKFSKKYKKVFIFSDDKKDFSHILPRNCIHIRLKNSLIYLLFGWLIFHYYVRRYKIKVAYLVGSPALPLVFLKPKNVITILEYNYLWNSSYRYDKSLTLRKKLIKNGITSFLISLLEKFLVRNFVNFIIIGTHEAYDFISKKCYLTDKKRCNIGLL